MKRIVFIVSTVFLLFIISCTNEGKVSNESKKIDTIYVHDTIEIYKTRNLSYDELKEEIHKIEKSNIQKFVETHADRPIKFLGAYYSEIKIINRALVTVYTDFAIEVNISSDFKDLKKETLYIHDVLYPCDTLKINYKFKLSTPANGIYINVNVLNNNCSTGIANPSHEAVKWDNNW